MVTEPALLIEREGFVVTLTMNRPEVKNAINMEMLCRLADAWDEIDADDGVRCAILTGAAGDFCAGADLDKLVARSMAGLPPEDEFEERIRKDYTIIFNGLLRNRQLKKPLIAAVEGYCVAGGTEILQGTDIRVAAEGSMFGVTEAKWSLYPQGGSVIRLRRQIPYTKAMEMLLTADMYPAEEALAFGLVGRDSAEGTGAGRRARACGEGVGERPGGGAEDQGGHHRDGVPAREGRARGRLPHRAAGVRDGGRPRGAEGVQGEADAEFHGEVVCSS